MYPILFKFCQEQGYFTPSTARKNCFGVSVAVIHMSERIHKICNNKCQPILSQPYIILYFQRLAAHKILNKQLRCNSSYTTPAWASSPCCARSRDCAAVSPQPQLIHPLLTSEPEYFYNTLQDLHHNPGEHTPSTKASVLGHS